MNIFISNLGDKVTDESLRATFATYGEVSSSKVVLDGFSGYSRGFAFVHMPNETEAAFAIGKMQGCVLDGRAIDVKEARPARQDHSYRWSN
jgi:RNA recognition motif-containing protein